MHNPGTDLFHAIELQDIETVISYIKNGSDLNQKNQKRLTPLMLACIKDNKDIVDLLVAHENVDININDGKPDELTAVMHAILADKDGSHKAIIDLLYNSGKLSEMDIHIALNYYASIGELNKVKHCINNNYCDVNFEHRLFGTPLIKATANNQISIAEALLKLPDIDINCTNYLEETPLTLSVRKGFIEIANLFLKRDDNELHIQSYLTGTPLTTAIFYKRNDLAIALINKEDKFQNELHPRALLCAIENDVDDIVQSLINKGADLNTTGENGYDEPEDWVWRERLPSPFFSVSISRPVFDLPLIVALKKNSLKALKILLDNDVDLHKQGTLGKSANDLIKTSEISAETKEIISSYTANKVKAKESIKLSTSNAIENKSLIPEMLLEPYKETFHTAWEDIIETQTIDETEQKLLFHVLNEGALTPKDVIRFARAIALPETLMSSIYVLYYALHPKQWDDNDIATKELQIIKKYLLTNTVKSSLPEIHLPEDEISRIEYLKNSAKIVVTDLISKNISLELNEEEKQLKESFLNISHTSSTEFTNQSSPRGFLQGYIEAYEDELKPAKDTNDNKSASYPTANVSKSISNFSSIITKSTTPEKKTNPSWKTLSIFSEEWKNIYNLVKCPPTYNRVRNERAMLNVLKAILYKEQIKCTWKDLPPDFDAGKAYYYYNAFKREGVLQDILDIVAQKINNSSPVSDAAVANTPKKVF